MYNHSFYYPSTGVGSPSLDPIADLQELELAEARRRAEYEQRHATLLRNASRSLSLGKARLSKSAGTSPVLAPIGYSVLLPPEDLSPPPSASSSTKTPTFLSVAVSGGSGPCYLENTVTAATTATSGAPFSPPICHHEECHKSFRKALKASRRYSGPALAPVPPLTLDHASNSPPTGTSTSPPSRYAASSHAGRQVVISQPSPGTFSHQHGYFPYLKPSPVAATDKERDAYIGATEYHPISQAPSPSLPQGDNFYVPSQTSFERGLSSSSTYAQHQHITPSASPFLRPLQTLGLASPSDSPILGGQNALHMMISESPTMEDVDEGEDADVIMESRNNGLRRVSDVQQQAGGKRRDSNSTVTQHDFPRPPGPNLKAMHGLPQVKSESTPASPTWGYRPRISGGNSQGSDSNGTSPPPLEVGMSAALSSPPSPSMHSHLNGYRRGFQSNSHSHNHLAHSVRMAFTMTQIKRVDSSSKAGGQLQQPQPQQQQHVADANSSSSSNNSPGTSPGPSGYTHVPGQLHHSYSHHHLATSSHHHHHPHHRRNTPPSSSSSSSVHSTSGSTLHTPPPPPAASVAAVVGGAGGQGGQYFSFPYSHPPSRAGSPPIMLPPLSSSTPHSAATTISSRAPSPSGYSIILPPLKVQNHGGECSDPHHHLLQQHHYHHHHHHHQNPPVGPMHGSVGTALSAAFSLDDTTTASNGGMDEVSSAISIPHDHHHHRHRGGEISTGAVSGGGGNNNNDCASLLSSSSKQSGNVGERIKLPGFSEIIRVTEP